MVIYYKFRHNQPGPPDARVGLACNVNTGFDAGATPYCAKLHLWYRIFVSDLAHWREIDANVRRELRKLVVNLSPTLHLLSP